MARLPYRSQSSLRSPSAKRKDTEATFIDSSKDKGVLRIVNGFRRRKGLHGLAAKFTSSSATVTSDQPTSTSGNATGESSGTEQSADKSSGTRIYKSAMSSQERTLRMKIKSKVPLAIETLLDSTDDSVDSQSYVSVDMSNYETNSNNCSPRTPESSQLCSFYCTPIVRSNAKSNIFFGLVLSSASPRSCASNHDDGQGWILITQLRSFFKGVLHETVENLQVGSDEIDAIIAPSEIFFDEETLYPFSVISSPARPTMIEMKARNSK